jgi:hypothetical protein
VAVELEPGYCVDCLAQPGLLNPVIASRGFRGVVVEEHGQDIDRDPRIGVALGLGMAVGVEEDLRLVESRPVVQPDLGHGVDPDPVGVAERHGADGLAPVRVADNRGQELEFCDGSAWVAGPDTV